MTKTQVLIATDGFLPRWDGISSFLNEMIPRLDDLFDISVIAPDFGELNVTYNARIVRFNTIKIRLADNYYASIVRLSTLVRAIRKSDVIFIQCLGPIGIWSILLGRIYRKPVVMYNHMLEWEVYAKSQSIGALKVPINVVTKLFAKYLYNRCSVIITPSLEQAELLNVLGIRTLKRIVHLGVDVDSYKPEKNKKKAKEKIGIDPKRFVIGYAGRVSYEKNLVTLYRAFMRFSKKYPDALLLIAGGGRPEIERLFQDKPNVMFTGLKDNLIPYYQAMDIYVLPSLVETTSLTTMEAMACGLPVLVTPVGFIKEYIDDGKNGMLIPKQSAYTLYRKLLYLKQKASVRHMLGRNARSTIVNNYNWDKTAEGIKKVIEESMSF